MKKIQFNLIQFDSIPSNSIKISIKISTKTLILLDLKEKIMFSLIHLN
jgi:hypothetical protein